MLTCLNDMDDTNLSLCCSFKSAWTRNINDMRLSLSGKAFLCAVFSSSIGWSRISVARAIRSATTAIFWISACSAGVSNWTKLQCLALEVRSVQISPSRRSSNVSLQSRIFQSNVQILNFLDMSGTIAKISIRTHVELVWQSKDVTQFWSDLVLGRRLSTMCCRTCSCKRRRCLQENSSAKVHVFLGSRS